MRCWCVPVTISTPRIRRPRLGTRGPSGLGSRRGVCGARIHGLDPLERYRRAGCDVHFRPAVSAASLADTARTRCCLIVSGISYIGRRLEGPCEPADLLERRTRRLVQRAHTAPEPITWLCAGAGSGKSRLLEALRAGNDGVAALDEPTPDALMQGLADLAAARIRRLSIATRPESVISPLLLREQMYGRVLLIGEPALFVTSEDAAGESDEALLSDTGGWPMLVAAGLEDAAARRANCCRYSSSCMSCRTGLSPCSSRCSRR